MGVEAAEVAIMVEQRPARVVRADGEHLGNQDRVVATRQSVEHATLQLDQCFSDERDAGDAGRFDAYTVELIGAAPSEATRDIGLILREHADPDLLHGKEDGVLLGSGVHADQDQGRHHPEWLPL
jgi:hypothetical protein